MRDPKADEINTPEFESLWKLMRHWDIGLPEDIHIDGGQLYSGCNGSHIVTILDAVRPIFKSRIKKLEAELKATQEMLNRCQINNSGPDRLFGGGMMSKDKGKKYSFEISIPADIEWTKTDWQDFYDTLAKFELRVIKRHKLPEIFKAVEYPVKKRSGNRRC